MFLTLFVLTNNFKNCSQPEEKVLTRNIALQHAKQKHDEWIEGRKNKVKQSEMMCSLPQQTKLKQWGRATRESKK